MDRLALIKKAMAKDYVFDEPGEVTRSPESDMAWMVDRIEELEAREPRAYEHLYFETYASLIQAQARIQEMEKENQILRDELSAFGSHTADAALAGEEKP